MGGYPVRPRRDPRGIRPHAGTRAARLTTIALLGAAATVWTPGAACALPIFASPAGWLQPRSTAPTTSSAAVPAELARRTPILDPFPVPVPAPTPSPSPSPSPVPSPERLEAMGARIGAVQIHAANIFDPGQPGENQFLFRLANRLHITTREEVIRRLLLFESGDPFSQRKLEESERLLRAERYLYDAHIRPVRFDGRTVDVEVATRDVWSLQLSSSFERAGGVNTFHVEAQEANLLGGGRDFAVRWETNVDRDNFMVRLRDRNLLGSRARLEASVSERSDGNQRRLDLDRPFYALDTRRAAGIHLLSEQRIDTIYRLGEIADEFAHEIDFLELYTGRSRGLVDSRTQRWYFGYTYDRESFAPATDRRIPSQLPPARTFSYPWVAWEWLEDGFVTAQDLDRIERTEDFNLGRHLAFRLGWSAASFGAEYDAALFSAAFRDGLRPLPESYLFYELGASGRLRRGVAENLVSSLGLRFYLRDFGRHVFYATLRADAATRLDPESQLLLGGDSGLRGYPLRYQDGDRRLLATLEQRFYHHREFFHVVRLGGAVFFDIGKAWFHGKDGPENLGWLSDVGLGLRVSSSRSARAAMVHFDVAMPLDGPSDVRSLQWLVTTSDTF